MRACLSLCFVVLLMASSGASAQTLVVEGPDGADLALEATLQLVLTQAGDASGSLNNIEDDIDFLRQSVYAVSDVDEVAKTKGDQGICYAQDFDGAALPGVVSAEGDAVRDACSLYGIRYSMLTNEDGSKTPLVVEDVAEAGADLLVAVASIRRDTAASSAGASGDWATLNTDPLGLLWTRTGDPCSSATTKLYLPFDITTATTTEITPSLAGSSTHYYICALNMVSQGANSVNLVDDNTDGCASVTASLISSGLAATDGWYFAANGGIAMGGGSSSVMRTQTTNAVLCLVTSAATELHGQFVVVAAP
jgi:hypothetical protein